MNSENVHETPAGWEKVVFADECTPCDFCDEVICEKCSSHYFECACPGPTQDGYDYKEFNGVLYARSVDDGE